MAQQTIDSIFLLSTSKEAADSFVKTYDGIFKHIEIILITNANYYADLLLAHRIAIQKSYDKGVDNTLILCNNPVLSKQDWHYFDKATEYIQDYNLDLLYLGTYRHKTYDATLVDANLVLLKDGFTTCNAVVYNRKIFNKILSNIPDTYDKCVEWCTKNAFIDQWLLANKNDIVSGCFNPELEISFNSINVNYQAYKSNSINEYTHIKAIRQAGKRDLAYVVFGELQLYFIWQIELFLYSLINNAKATPSDIIVLYSGVTPDEIPEHNPNYKMFIDMIHKYGVKAIKVDNVGKMPWYFRINTDKIYTRAYAGANKWTSLIEVANKGLFKNYKEVLLLEQDLWFESELPKLPAGNVVTSNWINNKDKAFANDAIRYPGLKLDNILRACNVTEENIALWKNGSIIFKFDNSTINDKKFLKKIIDYTQLILVMGELTHPEGARHETDMIAPCLALADCGIPIECISDDRLRSDTWCEDKEAPDGIVVHYGWDFIARHKDIDFSKFKYTSEKPWDNIDKLKELKAKSKYKWMINFFSDMITIGSTSK